ncbi:hypothetical protein [Frankia sp. AgB32]|uniref:hypothetical protein n=1 Tax=Frankia sp. AgB32 TaxID=631119 RepID=UPI00200E5A99|nr:hypothetical protein [Frankia sp. AgB32]MCK9895213.1 hypothetical protein [Frankia sp. AgB32]
MTDWVTLGTIDIADPGRYQIVHDNRIGVGVRRIDTGSDGRPVAGAVQHPCQPCSCCSQCGCELRGRCRGCAEHAEWAAHAEPQLQEYLAAVAAPEGWFVQRDTRIVHAPGCPSLKSTVDQVIADIEAGCTHVDRQGNVPRCPVPIREAEVQTGKRCRVCAPAITPPSRSGRYAAGGGRE